MESASASEIYRVVFARMHEALALVRLDPSRQGELQVLELNPAAQELSRAIGGRGRGGLGELFPGLFEERLAQHCREALDSGRLAELGERRLGASRFRISIIPLPPHTLALQISDSSAVQRLEQASVSLRKLSALLLSTLDVEEILDDLIEEAVCMLSAQSGVAALCTEQGFSSYRSFRKGLPAPPRHAAPGERIPGRVIAHSEPYLCNDVAADPRLDREMAAKHRIESAISTPIHDAAGRMIGFLEIHDKGGGGFTPFDLDQLCAAARITSLAVRNAEAFRRLTEMGRELGESTERYRHLVEGLDAIVWEADAETLRFSFVSPQAEGILGYPVDAWLEPGFWVEHILPEDREAALSQCRQSTARGKDHRFVYRARAADGRTVWLRDHARVVLDAEGKPSRLRGLMVDISEAKAIEESLRRSEARFRCTFQGAGIGMALVAGDGTVSQSNPALQSMLGYAEAELAGKNWQGLGHPDDAGNDAHEFAALAAGGVERYQVEKRLLRKDGDAIWGRLTMSALRLEGGANYAIAMLEDVSERKRAEARNAELLERLQEDAEELERRVAERTAQLQESNEELDSFAHSVSHDLKAPLRAIQGFVRILIEEQPPEPERLEYLRRMLGAAQGMERLIGDLLAYSRLSREELVLQPVSLEQVVREAVQQLELAEPVKPYRLEVDERLPLVLGQHAVLVQVLLNLINNGIKFVPPGVTPRLRIWGERRGEKCRLFVEDNGIGIAPQHQERIFKIFERLHSVESYPGTGVGLAIVRKALTRLGGEIGVLSREGEGSRFWIELTCAGEG